MKVVITDYQYDHIDTERAIIEGAGHSLFACQEKEPEKLIPLVEDADAVITQYADLNEAVIDKLRHCRLIIKYGIGVNNIDCKAAGRKGILVCNVPDYGVEEVSDHAVAMMLCLGKKLQLLQRSVREGRWGYQCVVPVKRFSECCAGLVGFGRIPRLVCQKLKAFGMEVLVYDPYVEEDLVAAQGAEKVSLEELCTRGDFISVHCPLTESTKHLIGEKELALMKKNCVLVNTARGGIVDEKALVEALKSNRIAGAGLDVFEEEPIRKTHPLLSMDNVIATPHNAWYSETAISVLQTKVAQEVVNVLAGGEPFHCVNREWF